MRVPLILTPGSECVESNYGSPFQVGSTCVEHGVTFRAEGGQFGVEYLFNAYVFKTISEVKVMAEEWRIDYIIVF